MASLHSQSLGQGPTLVLAHGFTQSGRMWGQFGRLIGHRRRLVSVDLPGHGESSEVVADLDEGGDLLIEAGGAQPFDLLGYSLGARFALHAALAAPGRIRRLILVSGTAGIEADDARADRRARDEATAARLETQPDVDEFIASWLAAPMFATLRHADAQSDERRRNTPAGLASSLRLAGLGTQTPLWNRLGELTMPVLVLAGATDPRYGALASRLSGGVAQGSFALVPGSGHAVHLEQPDVTAAIVGSWLAAGETVAD